jgi:hypothetical protein
MKKVSEQMEAKRRARRTSAVRSALTLMASPTGFTVNCQEQVPPTGTGIVQLGFRQKSPSFNSSMAMRWNGLHGVRKFSMFKAQTGTDYAYIKVKSPSEKYYSSTPASHELALSMRGSGAVPG